jgi:hypothetical protein
MLTRDAKFIPALRGHASVVILAVFCAIVSLYFLFKGEFVHYTIVGQGRSAGAVNISAFRYFVIMNAEERGGVRRNQDSLSMKISRSHYAEQSGALSNVV